MKTFLLIEPEELKSILDSCLDRFVEKISPKPQEPLSQERFNIEEATKYLKKEYGLDISKAQLYKQTHLKTIQAEKYGKRVIFTKTALHQWAESIKKLPINPREVMAERLAVQARRERRRV